MNFPPLKNDSLFRALKGEDLDRVPVWIMRQAGRYLPEFQELRAKHDFFTICRTPELACEVTLQPIRRFDLDAAIIFSDILVILQALGMEVEMVPAVGPVIKSPLKTPSDMAQLVIPVDISVPLHYVYEAVTLTRHKLEGKVPLIGFAGAPWTLFTYMTEGGGSKTMSKAKGWLYKWPEDSKKLLLLLTNLVVDHLVKQAKSGAQWLQVFESSAEHLGPLLFAEFSIPYLKEICIRVKQQVDIPMTIFAKGAHYAVEELAAIGYDVVGIDWTIDPVLARSQSNGLTLQGNLDPCALYSPPEELRQIAIEMVHRFGKRKYIANLGHGIYPDINPENVKMLIEAIHSV